MTIDFTRLWHVGVIVPDLASAMSELTAATGWEWTTPLERDVAVSVPPTEQSCPVRWAANRTEAPQLEVIEAGTGIWSIDENPGQTLHHLAYWSDDLEADARGLVEQGYTWEAHGLDEHGVVRFVYLLSPSGVRIELGATWSEAAWNDWTSGEEYSVRF